MVNFFDKLYTSIEVKIKILDTLKIYSMQRYLVRTLANIIIPLYYKITPNQKKRLACSDSKNRIIISLTSFPPRINRVWIVIESLLRQSYPPDMIILWLSKEQCASLDNLPARLLNLRAYGVQIRLKESDLRSYKKFIYTLQEYPDDLLVTVDDDIIYPTFMLEKLIELHRLYPDAICCHRAKLLTKKDGVLLPYNQWVHLKEFYGPSSKIFQTSGGGTLYPVESLHKDALQKDLFRKMCFTADDVWLNAMGQLQGTRVVKSDYYSYCLPVINRGDKKLFSINRDKNDEQIKNVINYCIEQNYQRIPFIYDTK